MRPMPPQDPGSIVGPDISICSFLIVRCSFAAPLNLPRVCDVVNPVVCSIRCCLVGYNTWARRLRLTSDPSRPKFNPWHRIIDILWLLVGEVKVGHVECRFVFRVIRSQGTGAGKVTSHHAASNENVRLTKFQHA
jgi:hypothetical protein